jgi:thioredoxin reductase (NADPH)
VAGVFVYLQGGKPITDFLGGQLATTEAGCLTVDAVMQTSLPGVFAVGDVLCHHLKQAVIAAAEGATAAMALQRYLSGRERLRPDWS